MILSEENLKSFALPLSQTEIDKCRHSIKMVVDALSDLGFTENGEIQSVDKDTPAYEARMINDRENFSVKIFLQGSYANNTNVRQHSDVDIAVVEEEQFRGKYRDGVSYKDYGFISVPSKQDTFKKVVYEALRQKFGKDVERKNKSIKINGNTYRKDADAVPALRYRNYLNDSLRNVDNYFPGILIRADDGEEIINYPELHIRNGIEKNKNTNHWYKKMVRVFKELRYRMIDEKLISAKSVSSFGVESLVYNVPDDILLGNQFDTYGSRVKKILEYWGGIININNLVTFKEVNGIKPLCGNNNELFSQYNDFIKDLMSVFCYEP